MLQLLVLAGKCQSGTSLILRTGEKPKPQRDSRHSPFRDQKDAEMVSPGFFLPANVAGQYLYSLFSIFGYECWGYHLHLGENCVLCFPGILFRGTLVLSFNQENRLVVFLLLNF